LDVKVRGAVMAGVGKDWEVTDITLDPPKAGEILVKMHRAGICHSDDHFTTGDLIPPPEVQEKMALMGIPPMEFFPLLGGHEGSGEVVEVGEGVTSLAVGDHVAASFITACGHCRWCVSGYSYICDTGIDLFSPHMVTDHTPRRHLGDTPLTAMTQLGTFAEYVVAAAPSFVKVDPSYNWDVVSLVSCGVATGFGAATEAAGTKPGDVVVVIGVGGIGTNAVQGARVAGARVILAVDLLEFKRDNALKFGATHTASSVEEAVLVLHGLTDGLMADRVIMSPGVLHGEILPIAMYMTRKGGTCVAVGIAPAHELSVPLSLGEMVQMAKTLKGTLYGNLNPQVDMPRLLALYRDGQLKLDELVTKRYKLDDINDAFKDMTEGRNIRGVITFD
jgi:NDMA-dependent alcohol dehydrogenase